MNTTRAYAFLSWLLALFGLVLRWDALSNAPGGVLGDRPTAARVGAVVAAVFALVAVGLHVLEFFQRRGRP